MEFIAELGLFALKTIFIVGAILVVATFLFQAGSAQRHKHSHQIEIEKLNHRFRHFRHRLQSHILGKKDFKGFIKAEKKAEKQERDSKKSRVFVLDFNGDIRASAVESLREEVTALLSVITPAEDEVVIRLESGGGMVHSYGLAASQLARLREAGVKLTICIDKVAASGGYMMACVGSRVLAAPFAIVGSIGVIAQIPNFNKILKRHDVDYREVTAGEFKRTLTLFGEVTDTGVQKFKEQIEDTHRLFKDFVSLYRSQIDIAKVATGEHWYGTQALSLNLIDEIRTSDDYLYQRSLGADVYRIHYISKKSWYERLPTAASEAIRGLIAESTRF